MPPPKEQFADLIFPTRGIEVVQEYAQQRDGTTPVGLNVQTFEPLTGRARGGQRPGLTKYINAQVSGPNKIQHLNLVVDPTQTALIGDYSSEDPNAILDPSDSDGQPNDRNPGRYIRPGGSGAQPVRGVKLAKRPLTITAKNQVKTQGATFTFAGTEFTQSGLDLLDTIDTVTLSSPGAAASATSAGSPYPIFCGPPTIGYVPTDDPPGQHGPSGLKLKYNTTYVNGLMYVSPGPPVWNEVSISAVWTLGPFNILNGPTAKSGETPHPGVYNQNYFFAATSVDLSNGPGLWSVSSSFYNYLLNFFNANFSPIGQLSQSYQGPSTGFVGTPSPGSSYSAVGALRLVGTFTNLVGTWMYDCGTVTWTVNWLYF